MPIPLTESLICWPFVRIISFIKSTIELQSARSMQGIASRNITYGNMTFDMEYFQSSAYLKASNPEAARRKAARLEAIHNFSLSLNSSTSLDDKTYQSYHYKGYPHDHAAIKFIKDNSALCLLVQSVMMVILVFAIMAIVGRILIYYDDPTEFTR